MKILLLFLFICFSLLLKGQRKLSEQKLYYFLTRDSLMGVKTGYGKVIIQPRRKYHYTEVDFKKQIKGELIYLDIPGGDIVELHSFGGVYNRMGQFLFAPFFLITGQIFFQRT